MGRTENAKRYRERHRDKFRLLNKNPHKKAQKAAQKIEIPYGKKCEICNKIYAFERHHEDYNMPLKVMFVCKKCHTEIHFKKEKVYKVGCSG